MKAKIVHLLRAYFSHILVALLTLGFFLSVYTALAVNYVTPGLTLDPGADFPVLCADPLNDCTTEILRIGNPIGGATSGSIPFVDASGNLAEDNTNLFWDETNNRLGIGTNAPGYTLDLSQTTVAPIISEDNTSVFGLEDATFAGTYVGAVVDAYCIEIFDDVTVPNTFNFYDSGCGNLAVSNVSITAGVAQTMDNGVTVTFASDSGHTAGDVWFVNLTPGTYSGDVNFGGSLYKGGALWSGAIGGIVENASANVIPFVDSAGVLAEDSSFLYDPAATLMYVNGIYMPATTSTTGIVYNNGVRFMHAYGTNNTFFGSQAGNFSLTTASAQRNTALGVSALDALTTGDDNIAVGNNALGSNTTGVDNTAVGLNALIFNVSGNSNAAVGRLALQRNTGSNNTALGASSFQLKGPGDGNVGIGTNALFGVTTNYTANYNVGIGYGALLGIDTGADYNVAIGESAGGSGPLTGDLNVLIGRGAGDSVTSGSNNVNIGADAGALISSGSDNTILGDNAGNTLTTGSRNILIGKSVDVPTLGTSDYLSLGDVLFGDLSTDFVGVGDTTPDFKFDVEGNTSGAAVASFFNDGNNTDREGIVIFAGVDDHTAASTSTLASFRDGDGTVVGSITFGSSVTAFNTTSDERLKDNIVDTDLSIDDLMDIQVRDFTWRADRDDKVTHGFIAQELYDVYPGAVTLPAKENGFWMVDYSKLMPLTIKALQDVQLEVTDIQTLAEGEDSFVERIRAWLASASNGIQNIFAKRVTTDELCVEDVCVTRDEFLQLLENAGVDGSNDDTPPVPDEGTQESPGDDMPEGTDETPVDGGVPADGEQPIDSEPVVDEPTDEEPLPEAPPADEPASETEPAEPAL